MKLNELSDRPGSKKVRRRIGRGIGSGRGKMGGRGGKGQTARSGYSGNGFEGGQMPLYRRLPKRGFANIFRKDFVEVSLDRIEQAIAAGRLDPAQTINVETLKAAGIIKRARDGIRLLGGAEPKRKLTIDVAGASRPAIAAVEKAGGTVNVIAPPAEPTEAEAKA